MNADELNTHILLSAQTTVETTMAQKWSLESATLLHLCATRSAGAGAPMFVAFTAQAALHGTREEILGTEAVWQTPPGTAKGLLFLAHGCNHGAIDFWPQSAACTQCIGLPEEVRITKETLRAGWAVIAISSADRDGSRCWSIESDGPAVAGR